MATLIRVLLQNFTLTFLVLGLLVSGFSLLRRRRSHLRGRTFVAEELLAYFLLFSIAISFFTNFVLHTFFGAMTAAFIGWQPSPFQAEVGMASLGYAVVGLLAFRGSAGLRTAAVVGPAIFLLGAAAGHVRQMLVAHNFAPGNAGVIFYTDLGLPVLGLLLLWLRYRPGTLQPPTTSASGIS